IRFMVDGAVSAGVVPMGLQFNTGSSWGGIERMRITSGGNVGIGTDSPAYLLDIFGSSSTPLRVRDSSSREYISTATHTGAYGVAPLVNLAGGRLIVDSNSPFGGNDTVLRRTINSFIIPPSDYAPYPGMFIISQPNGTSILFVDQATNGNIGVGT